MGSQTKTKRSWFLIFFGACFAAPALYVLIAMLATPFYNAARMQFWEPVEAKLLSSEVKYYQGDSTTYKVIADYTYPVNGRVYEGDRVSLYSGSDNVGSYHQDMGRKLRNSDNLVTVYYNPDNPQESIIDRSIRWGMVGFMSIFGVLFGMVGVGAMWFGWRGDKRIVTAESHEKPWTSKPEWAANKIYSNAKLEMYGLLFFSVFWNLITWPAVILGAEKIYEKLPLIVCILFALFPIIGVYLIYITAKAVTQRKRFGKTPLTLTPFPGSIGGQIGGKIILNNNASELAIYSVKVICVRKHYSGSGKNRSLRESMVWEADTFANNCVVGAGSGIEFSVDVPEGLPETELDKNDSWHQWRVEVESEEIKFKRSFDIPVYETKQQSTISYKVPQALMDNKQETDLENSLPLQEQGGKVSIHYPMFYKPMNKMIMIFVALFMQALLGVFKDEMPSFLYWVIFSIATLMLVFTVKALLSSLTVVFKNRTLNVKTGLLGINTKNAEVPFSEIEGIEQKEVMRSQSGNKHTVHFSILALLHSGEKLPLAKQVDGQAAANTVEAYLREKLSLPSMQRHSAIAASVHSDATTS